MTNFQLTDTNRLQYKGYLVSWSDIFNLVKWPQNTEPTVKTIARLNQFENGFESIQKQMDLQMRLAPLVDQLNRNGITLDFDTWRDSYLNPKWTAYCERYQLITGNTCIGDVNTARNIVQDKLGSKVSLEPKALGQLALSEPLCNQLLQLKKDWDFVRRFSFNEIDCSNGQKLIHGIWQENGSLSGRFSCHDTNLLGLPKKLKGCLIPKNDLIMSIDLSAIQLRIAAALTDCVGLQNYFKSGTDIHRLNGHLLSKALGLTLEPARTRKLGKQFIYMLMYGAGNQAFQKFFGELKSTPVYECEVVSTINLFYHQYPELMALKSIYLPNNKGFNIPKLGFVPVMVDLSSSQAINLPVQFMEAYIFKNILLAIRDYWQYLLLPCHDELILDVPRTLGFETIEQIIIEAVTGVMPNIVTKNICKKTGVVA